MSMSGDHEDLLMEEARLRHLEFEEFLSDFRYFRTNYAEFLKPLEELQKQYYKSQHNQSERYNLKSAMRLSRPINRKSSSVESDLLRRAGNALRKKMNERRPYNDGAYLENGPNAIQMEKYMEEFSSEYWKEFALKLGIGGNKYGVIIGLGIYVFLHSETGKEFMGNTYGKLGYKMGWVIDNRSVIYTKIRYEYSESIQEIYGTADFILRNADFVFLPYGPSIYSSY